MILDKAKMAHDWVMKYGKVDSNYNRENTVQLAWEYADAMQAEADKRAVELPDVFFDAKRDEEWQIKCDELQGRIDEAMDYIAESGGVNLTSEMALNHILKGNKDEN